MSSRAPVRIALFLTTIYDFATSHAFTDERSASFGQCAHPRL